MKKMILLLALTIPLMAGTMFPGYNSSAQMQNIVQAKRQDSSQDLKAVQKNTYLVAHQEATAEEWKTFHKGDFERKIKANEIRITELNVKIRKSSGLFDSFYLKKIANLEKENRFMKARLEAYEMSQSNI